LKTFFYSVDFTGASSVYFVIYHYWKAVLINELSLKAFQDQNYISFTKISLNANSCLN